jgi:hypothetical protein
MLLQPSTFKPSSFHDITIETKPKHLIELCTKYNINFFMHNDGEDKSNFDFEFETPDGLHFTVYDWKEYKKLDFDKIYKFHIGTENLLDSLDAKEVLVDELNNLE